MKLEFQQYKQVLTKKITKLTDDVACVVTDNMDEEPRYLAQIKFDYFMWYPCGLGDTPEEAVYDAIRRACKKSSEMLAESRLLAALHNVDIEADDRDKEIENLKDEICRLTPGDEKPYRPF